MCSIRGGYVGMAVQFFPQLWMEGEAYHRGRPLAREIGGGDRAGGGNDK